MCLSFSPSLQPETLELKLQLTKTPSRNTFHHNIRVAKAFSTLLILSTALKAPLCIYQVSSFSSLFDLFSSWIVFKKIIKKAGSPSDLVVDLSGSTLEGREALSKNMPSSKCETDGMFPCVSLAHKTWPVYIPICGTGTLDASLKNKTRVLSYSSLWFHKKPLNSTHSFLLSLWHFTNKRFHISKVGQISN